MFESIVQWDGRTIYGIPEDKTILNVEVRISICIDDSEVALLEGCHDDLFCQLPSTPSAQDTLRVS